MASAMKRRPQSVPVKAVQRGQGPAYTVQPHTMQGGSCLSRFKVALVILQKRAVKGVLHTEAAQAPVRPQGEGQLLLGATGQSLHRVIQEITPR